MVKASSADPVQWPRTIVRGTDHEWILRRVDAAGAPIIPTEARAQVRGFYGGPIWVECAIAIDAVAGWITVGIPEAATEAPEWDTRQAGIWDLEAVAAGAKLRWVQGPVTVSQDVTREAAGS